MYIGNSKIKTPANLPYNAVIFIHKYYKKVVAIYYSEKWITHWTILQIFA